MPTYAERLAAHDLVETPIDIARYMLQRANVRPGMTVLEPSAGKGNIAIAAAELGAVVTAWEISPDTARALAHGSAAIGMTLGAGAAMASGVDNMGLSLQAAAEAGTTSSLSAFKITTAEIDFMTAAPEPLFDRVVLAPPVSGGADVIHLRHALGFVKPGGRAVALINAENPQIDDVMEELGLTVRSLHPKAFNVVGSDLWMAVAVADKQ